jgi:peptide/nickel transport system permease protein
VEKASISNSVNATRSSVLERLARVPPGIFIGGFILLVHAISALTCPLWMPYTYNEIGTGVPFSPPSAEHLLGTDQLGRDMFSRVAYGGRIDLGVALAGTTLGVGLGAIIGLLAAYIGGWFDEIIMRSFEVLISIPLLVLALLIIAAAGPDLAKNLFFLAALIGFVYMPRVARTMRATAIEIVTRDFVAIARARGESAWSIMWRELLPNATSTLLVEFAVNGGATVVVIGSLGFLGFGARSPIPEWGLMISENRNVIVAAPHTVVAPGLAVASLVIGLNLFSEGLARILGRSVQRGG